MGKPDHVYYWQEWHEKQKTLRTVVLMFICIDTDNRFALVNSSLFTLPKGRVNNLQGRLPSTRRQNNSYYYFYLFIYLVLLHQRIWLINKPIFCCHYKLICFTSLLQPHWDKHLFWSKAQEPSRFLLIVNRVTWRMYGNGFTAAPPPPPVPTCPLSSLRCCNVRSRCTSLCTRPVSASRGAETEDWKWSFFRTFAQVSARRPKWRESPVTWSHLTFLPGSFAQLFCTFVFA